MASSTVLRIEPSLILHLLLSKQMDLTRITNLLNSNKNPHFIDTLDLSRPPNYMLINLIQYLLFPSIKIPVLTSEEANCQLTTSLPIALQWFSPKDPSNPPSLLRGSWGKELPPQHLCTPPLYLSSKDLQALCLLTLFKEKNRGWRTIVISHRSMREWVTDGIIQVIIRRRCPPLQDPKRLLSFTKVTSHRPRWSPWVEDPPPRCSIIQRGTTPSRRRTHDTWQAKSSMLNLKPLKPEGTRTLLTILQGIMNFCRRLESSDHLWVSPDPPVTSQIWVRSKTTDKQNRQRMELGNSIGSWSLLSHCRLWVKWQANSNRRSFNRRRTELPSLL